MYKRQVLASPAATLAGWLPRGDGIVVQDLLDRPTQRFTIVGLDGTLSPLAVDADEILDILPE